MANIKPIDLKLGNISKAEIEARKKAEKSMKGRPISSKAPSGLTSNGKKIYKHLIGSFPKEFLTETDVYSLEILCNAIDMMQISQKDIKRRGSLVDGVENPSIRIYEKYYKIYNTIGGKLGMSPRDRSQLAMIMVNQQAVEEDPLISMLKD